MTYNIYTDLSYGFGEEFSETVSGDKVKLSIHVFGQNSSKSISVSVNGRAYQCSGGVCLIPKTDFPRGESTVFAMCGEKNIPMENLWFDGNTLSIVQDANRSVQMLYARAIGELFQKVRMLEDTIEKAKENGGILL